MSTTTYYTATSLDGFIADEEHSLEWLFRQDQDEVGPLNYDEFSARLGAVVMGSTTYKWILRHEQGGWPLQLPTWVMTSRRLPMADGDVRFARGGVRSVHEAMTAAADGDDLWVVGGGDLAGQFADAGLLDEIIVYIAPVTLGGGGADAAAQARTATRGALPEPVLRVRALLRRRPRGVQRHGRLTDDSPLPAPCASGCTGVPVAPRRFPGRLTGRGPARRPPDRRRHQGSRLHPPVRHAWIAGTLAG